MQVLSDTLFCVRTYLVFILQRCFFVQQQFSVSVKTEFSKNSELLLGYYNFRLWSMFIKLKQCGVVMFILTGLLGRLGISQSLQTTSETPIQKYLGA